MQLGERVSIFLKISLPFLILVLLNVSPVSRAVTKDLREAGAAQLAEQSPVANSPETIAKAYRRVLAREPWRAALWDPVGQAELASGRVPEAIDALRQAEKAGALSEEGRFQLGEAYLRLGKPQEAVGVLEFLLRLEGPSARVFERLYQIQRSQGDFPAAIAVLRAWRAYAPKEARAQGGGAQGGGAGGVPLGA